jgi:hypothetical protein
MFHTTAKNSVKNAHTFDFKGVRKGLFLKTPLLSLLFSVTFNNTKWYITPKNVLAFTTLAVIINIINALV